MTSICNYSHPELQITEGLVHHHTGSLFPYNPEFYSLASGLYGPGAMYCWELLLLSVVLSWSFHPKGDDGCRRPGVSNDLLGVMAYPAFAATDMLVHGMKFLGTEHRALALFCLRIPEVMLDGFATFNHTQLDLRDVPPNVLSLGQRAVDLTGPLTVCYTSALVFFVAVLGFINLPGIIPWQPTKWAQRLINATYGYVVLALTIFHLSLGNWGISFLLSLYEALNPIFLIVLFGSCAFMLFTFLAVIAGGLLARNEKEVQEAGKAFGSWLLLAVLVFAPGVAVWYYSGITFVPDLGIAVSERDQLATLLVGLVTLGFTLYEIGHHHWEAERDGDATELQALGSDLH